MGETADERTKTYERAHDWRLPSLLGRCGCGRAHSSRRRISLTVAAACAALGAASSRARLPLLQVMALMRCDDARVHRAFGTRSLSGERHAQQTCHVHTRRPCPAREPRERRGADTLEGGKARPFEIWAPTAQHGGRAPHAGAAAPPGGVPSDRLRRARRRGAHRQHRTQVCRPDSYGRRRPQGEHLVHLVAQQFDGARVRSHRQAACAARASLRARPACAPCARLPSIRTAPPFTPRARSRSRVTRCLLYTSPSPRD